MEVARPIEEEWRREIRLVFSIKFIDQTRRRGEAQLRPPRARVNHRKPQRLTRPRVIQIEMFEMFHQSTKKSSLPLHEYHRFAYAIIAIRSSLCAQLSR